MPIGRLVADMNGCNHSRSQLHRRIVDRDGNLERSRLGVGRRRDRYNLPVKAFMRECIDGQWQGLSSVKHLECRVWHAEARLDEVQVCDGECRSAWRDERSNLD